MRVRTQITVVLMAMVGASKAQHSPVTSQYLFNMLLINPAYAGSRDALAANLTWRQQWVGFEGAPVTQVMSIHAPINKRRVGAGLLITNDQIGVSHETGFLTNYAFRVPFRKGKLSMGIGGGLSLLSARWSTVQLQNSNDAAFYTDTRTEVRPNFSAGVFYYRKNLFIGASLPFLVSHISNSVTGDRTVASRPEQYQPMVTGGYLLPLGRDFKLKPSLLVRYMAASGVQADLNTNLIIRDRFWAGVSYRTGDAVVGMIEFLPTPQWRFGYAYDLGINRLAPHHGGTHEVMLQYEFGYRMRVRNTIYF